MKLGDPRDQDLQGARVWRDEANDIHIDVTALPAPEPFIAVLKLIEWPTIDLSHEGEALIFHNDIMPIHLFSELGERGLETDIMQNTDEGFIMRIFKPKTS